MIRANVNFQDTSAFSALKISHISAYSVKHNSLSTLKHESGAKSGNDSRKHNTNGDHESDAYAEDAAKHR